MKIKLLYGILLFVLSITGARCGLADDPFSASGVMTVGSNGVRRLEISISVPEKHYLYVDATAIMAKDAVLEPIDVPGSKQKDDPFTGGEVSVYTHDVTFTYEVRKSAGEPIDVEVGYQGCSDKVCFLPATILLSVGSGGAHQPVGKESGSTLPVTSRMNNEPASEGWVQIAGDFKRGGSASGYLAPGEFLNFLESARSGDGRGGSEWAGVVESRGWMFAFLLILLGGLALNLTPCVLPMIPVNLAIIGAGTESTDKRRGLLLGSAYGCGMAIVYGALGLLVVLTGARFGALNSSPWFNVIICVLFLVMALSMFDVIHIDFSRFQSKIGGWAMEGASLPAALLLGGVMALLAGACVAPVVISVLLFATDLYAGGHVPALLLPFLLGIGMALPWPFAGAGLSFLPKPGRWMQKVKYGFGAIILVVGLYYGRLAVGLFVSRGDASRELVEKVQEESEKDDWMNSLDSALSLALQQQKPVLVDFWATWCKSCLQMEKTTFNDPAVRESMDAFVMVKYNAENLADPAVKEVLDYFGVIGLPTYVVLVPVVDGR